MSRASITGYVDGQVRKEIEALIEKFNATHTEDDLKKDEKSRRDTNMAVQLFSRFVVANKNRFRNDKDFHQMQRAYLNILQYADGKKMVIGEVLDSFDGLDPGIKDRIKSLSREGKYVGIARTLRRKNAHYRTKFLDLIEAFTADHPYDVLLGKFKRFRGGTRGGGAAALTGILSSLQPEHFMAYNTRSSLPLADTVYRDLANVDLNRYERFNRIYRNIRKTTGKSLVALDIIANGRYLDNSD